MVLTQPFETNNANGILYKQRPAGMVGTATLAPCENLRRQAGLVLLNTCCLTMMSALSYSLAGKLQHIQKSDISRLVRQKDFEYSQCKRDVRVDR